MGLFQYARGFCFCLLLVFKTCVAGSQHSGKIYPGFTTSQLESMDNDGLFLLSNNSTFGFGFFSALDVRYFLLVVIHISSGKVVWTANRGLLISNSDKFVFEKNGIVYLQRGNGVAWSANTSREKVAFMELRGSGNLVLLGERGSIVWQSFSHPTDTLLSGQEFVEGMSLKSFPKSNNLSVYLEFKSGDLVLYAGYQTPQTYWSLANDSRKTSNSASGKIHYASLVSNAWNFYDHNKSLLWQFIFSGNNDENATWAAILGSDEVIRFYDLHKGKAVTREAIKIPQNSCSVPEFCGPYYVCFFDSWCECPMSLKSQFDCKPPIASTCNSSKNAAKLFYVGEKLDYFALNFVLPFFSRYSLKACKEACLHNCSCSVLFFENSTGNCFLFDQIGSLQRARQGSTGYVSYMKISSGNGGLITKSQESRNEGKNVLLVRFIIVSTILAIAGLLYVGIWYYKKKKRLKEFSQELEEDNFLDVFSGMPVRFSYNDLCRATKNFSTKLGQGGFGSVYLGMLPEGTQLAVKKLESIGQGKKEFRAEVTIIGDVRHVHLVKLKGFCIEKAHRLLVYEYMANGSLDKWIFKTAKGSRFLNWNTRFNIALGTAKGLAYLHEECEVKIVHCDIKPENVLLDDNFIAKVSDFGLAKLMNREESLVYTTLRGTRGYLAPEWITNHPISEKSDVYSYGVVLLEIIGGRKSYDPEEDSKKAQFPSYAFKMLEEGKLGDIIDPMLDIDEIDERVATTAIKVALWCIQDEMHLRPPMTMVVQMLEGVCAVPQPPTPSQLNSWPSIGFIKWSSDGGTSSGLPDDNSGAILSDVQLSGPR